MESIEPKYQLTGIEIVSKTMNPAPPPEMTGQEFLFDVKSEIRVLADKKLLIGYVRIEIKVGPDKPIGVGSLDMSCIFTVDNFEETIKLNAEKLYEIPPALQLHITTVSVSTSRGVLFSEFRGTYLGSAVLPLVNLSTEAFESAKTAK